MMLIAFTRAVSPTIGQCELTHRNRSPIEFELARTQHCEYEACLRNLGCDVRRLPDLPDQPDAVFVEDTCVVFPEIAIVARPGAAIRRLEVPSVSSALMSFREPYQIQSPATLDGGDVLVVGKNVYVGRSSRTNVEGIRQVRDALSTYGYSVIAIEVDQCLHLKSAVSYVGRDTVLINRQWINAAAFANLTLIDVSKLEPDAANVLLVNSTVVLPAHFTATRKRLKDAGLNVKTVDMSELAKAEGGVTCCSVIFEI